MYLLSVIPISRGVGKAALTYYSGAQAGAGALVQVPLRGRSVPAVVLSCAPAEQGKSHIRQARFTTKKVSGVLPGTFFTPVFLKAAGDIAEEFVTTTGAVLHALTPRTVLGAPDVAASGTAGDAGARSPACKSETLVLQAPYRERIDCYRNLIRESFARGESVVILAPTGAHAENVHASLADAFKDRTFLLCGSLTKKKQLEHWSAAAQAERPVVVVLTGGFLALPRADAGVYVIEHEHSRFYKMPARPFIDVRIAAFRIARAHSARAILADMPLSLETLKEHAEETYEELIPLHNRLSGGAKRLLVDMRRPERSEEKRKDFRAVSDALIEFAGKKQTFVFVTRRGLATTVVCQDCGESVACSRCGGMMGLRTSRRNTKKGERVFYCRGCGSEESALAKCKHCDSWRLKELGVGIERVVDELHGRLPDIEVLRLDRERVRTHAAARRLAKKFYESPRSVLVGTEMALPYLTKPVAQTALTSLDAALAIPEFRAHEQAFGLLIRLHQLAHERMLVQTRTPESPLLGYFSRGGITAFGKDELETRRELGFPPFTTLVKLSLSGTRAGERAEQLRELLADYGAQCYEHRGAGGRLAWHVLLSFPPERLHEPLLQERLRSLPPHISVNVHPSALF